MKRTLLCRLVYVVLFLFAPLAFIPSSGRSAFLPSSASAHPSVRTAPKNLLTPAGFLPEERIRYLAEEEAAALGGENGDLLAGGQRSSPLETNEIVAIFLTLIMIGVVIGFVEQTRK